MRASDQRSRSPASSDSGSQAQHPIDAIISAVKNRDSAQSSPAVIDITRPEVQSKTKRKKRSETASPVVLSSDDLTDEPSSKRAKQRNSPGAALPASNPPIGVTVVDEGEHVRNPEMQRLLRGARYFDDQVEEAGKRCFKCGQRGHMQADCQNQPKRVPCALCAQFGHNKAHCPSLLCYKCQKRGHIARDCPNAGQYGASPDAQPPKICLRCGRGSCSAAGLADYHRAEGACTERYLDKDLTLVRCYVCNRMGHLCCTEAPQDPVEPSCYNCGDEGHLGTDCWRDKPNQVVMERQQGERHSREQHYRDRPRYEPADRWVPDNRSHYSGASMALGNGYASRVNAMQQRSLVGASNVSTPREYSSNRFYPGSEKGREQTYSRFQQSQSDFQADRHAPYAVPYSAPPAGRWRR